MVALEESRNEPRDGVCEHATPACNGVRVFLPSSSRIGEILIACERRGYAKLCDMERVIFQKRDIAKARWGAEQAIIRPITGVVQVQAAAQRAERLGRDLFDPLLRT